jgi:hypothetical protein
MQPAHAAPEHPLLRRARELLEGTPSLLKQAEEARRESAALTARCLALRQDWQTYCRARPRER